MTDYVFDDAWQEARRRLALMERALDPGTARRLERIGVGAGWRCLEVGAGGGSVAEWLAARVAPGGWLLVEDFHEYPAADPDSVPGRAGAESRRLAERAGISADWGRRLPERLCALGLDPVEAEAELMVYRGGTELAESWRLSYRQLRDHVAAAGGATPGIDALLPLFDDRAAWFRGPVVMGAWGRRR